MKKLLTTLAILLIATAAPAHACLQSTGESENDKKVAAQICNKLKGISDILMLSVQESILYVDISRELYDEMMMDKLSAHQLIQTYIRGMEAESGHKVVTVWVYVNKVKVIEGATSWTGEDKIKFLL